MFDACISLRQRLWYLLGLPHGAGSHKLLTATAKYINPSETVVCPPKRWPSCMGDSLPVVYSTSYNFVKIAILGLGQYLARLKSLCGGGVSYRQVLFLIKKWFSCFPN